MSDAATHRLELDSHAPSERRDLANALLRAAWSAAPAQRRIVLLNILVEADPAILGGTA